jgi:hypothetical protein
VGERRKEKEMWIGFGLACSRGIPQVSLSSFSADLDENFVPGAQSWIYILVFPVFADLP